MADRLTTSRILLCLTHRTGYALPFAPLTSGTHVTLSRVSPGDSAAIGRSIVGAVTLAGELQQLIEEKTEGNPFFVEEVLRSLQERGLLERRGDEVGLRVRTATIVPDSVQDVLLGRLERLDPASRDALRVASVVGREFPKRVLERVISSDPLVLEDRLRTLRAAELI
jgi:predicted ATPase